MLKRLTFSSSNGSFYTILSHGFFFVFFVFFFFKNLKSRWDLKGNFFLFSSMPPDPPSVAGLLNQSTAAIKKKLGETLCSKNFGHVWFKIQGKKLWQIKRTPGEGTLLIWLIHRWKKSPYFPQPNVGKYAPNTHAYGFHDTKIWLCALPSMQQHDLFWFSCNKVAFGDGAGYVSYNCFLWCCGRFYSKCLEWPVPSIMSPT